MDVPSVLMFLLPNVWPLLVNGLWQLAIPDFMRPGLFFGVTVDPQFHESRPARAIRRRYSSTIWITTLIIIAVVATATFVATGAFAAPAALATLVTHRGLQWLPWMLQLAVTLFAFVWANRATRPYATQPASVVGVELSAKPPATSAILLGLALPIASLALLAVWTGTHWRDVPARLAVHWGFGGPDRWVSTTPAHVATWLFLNTVVCFLLALLTWGVLHGSRRLATAGEAATRERRFRTLVISLLMVAEYFSVFPVWAGLLDLPSTPMTLWQLVFPATMLILLAGLALAGQGGTRGLARGNRAVGDRTNDRYWIWGMLYFNRGDPALLVEKRFGIGYTFNFAHPFACALLAIIVVITLATRLL
jgi:uncharacterized membrane protein